MSRAVSALATETTFIRGGLGTMPYANGSRKHNVARQNSARLNTQFHKLCRRKRGPFFFFFFFFILNKDQYNFFLI